MPWHVMPEYDSYERARETFEWSLPERYNPAVDCLRKHESPAPEERVALLDAATGERYSFADVDERACRLANGLASLDVEPGDRVGVVSPQRPETPIAHLACWLLGAVTVPLTTLFGRDALAYRLDDAEARVVVFDPQVEAALAAASEECPDLETAVALDEHPLYAGDRDGSDDADTALPFDCDVVGYRTLVADRSATVDPHDATPDTDSAIMYTSGSTGPPKGVRHRHAVWAGRAAAAHTFFDAGLGAEAVCWTPADWAWGSALGGLLLGTWHYGGTVVAAPMAGFDPEAAFSVLDAFDVTHALIPPTALRMLMNATPPAALPLEAIASAGEPLTPEILDWADERLDDVAVNEYYGQTELNLVVANSRWFEVRPGSMGKALPGYDIAVLDPETREELPAGEVGELAVRSGDERVFFAEYWNRPEATAEKRHDGWFLTDDLVSRDDAGYVRFESRADDVIITSGYRVGPLEVEQVVLDHPAVEQVGVVGVPDDTRGEVIKAFVELVPDVEGDADLRAELQERARERLAAYEYPREIEFVESLPKTSSGKIRRVELRDRAE
ncbi:acyl-CoA synthetase [Halomarina oriensis]|uniref:AMP-binding protein n=1 Tax=Halomarina oriensis TaxID=671145 RepID=A0A6B0GI21_9EURY|nr:AMP-binding protein [Halomarina oriensis]MWG34512.1 AMP-binding protein [Halomarina oriensis]